MTEKKFTSQQMTIVADIVQTYDTDPNDITFFTPDPEPFLGYETACVMLNRLIPDLQAIDAEPIFQASPDSISIKIILTDAKGRVRSGLGTVNKGEKDADGNLLGSQQMQYIAMSRGLRSAMRMAGIDLMRLHRSGETVTEFSGSDTSDERKHLSRQLHALATEVGYIQGTERTAYSRFLMHRYGVSSSAQLSEDLMRDAIAALSAIRPPQRMAA